MYKKGDSVIVKYSGESTTVRAIDYESGGVYIYLENGNRVGSEDDLEPFTKMKTAIEKAWEENLKLPKDEQFESKEDLIENCCPCGDYYLKIEGFEDDEALCKYHQENCTKCWNSEIEEDKQEQNLDNKSELTFEQLEKSPIKGIELNYSDTNAFEKAVLIGREIIYIEGRRLQKNDISKLRTWLQDVDDYCNKLKRKINYVDFNFAKAHMMNGDKAMFEDETYYIENGELYCEDINSACALKLRAIESDKWILL